MKKIIVAGFIIITASVSFASWAHIPLTTLVQECDLIIVGQLTGVTESEWPKYNLIDAKGTIHVKEVLWGNATPGDKLTLRWQSAKEGDSLSHTHQQNVDLIWLLRHVTMDDTFDTGHPGNVMPLKMKDRVIYALLKNPVVLRLPETFRCKNGGSQKISIVYRNAGNKEIKLPFWNYKNGRLTLDPRLAIKVYRGCRPNHTRIFPKPNSIIYTKKESSLTVKSGEQISSQVDLATLFDLSHGGYYSIELSVKGQKHRASVLLPIPDKVRGPGQDGLGISPPPFP